MKELWLHGKAKNWVFGENGSLKHPKSEDFPIHKPIIDLTKKQYELLWKRNKTIAGIDDFFKEVEANLYKVQYRVLLSRYRGRTHYPECCGYRLKKRSVICKSKWQTCWRII